MSEDSSIVEISGDSPQFQEATVAATRMWYAFAQAGEVVEGATLMLATSLLLSKQADYYAEAGGEHAYIDEVARVARVLLDYQQAHRVPQ